MGAAAESHIQIIVHLGNALLELIGLSALGLPDLRHGCEHDEDCAVAGKQIAVPREASGRNRGEHTHTVFDNETAAPSLHETGANRAVSG